MGYIKRGDNVMELHQLECFAELAHFQNVSLTAEKLNISQPALSKTIALLESELGCNLFDRVGRRIVLNDRGRIFMRYVEEALKNVQLAKGSVFHQEYHPSGTITIALFSYAGHIVDCLNSFLEKYPLAKFEVYSSKTQYTIDNFNTIDFTLTSALNSGQMKPFKGGAQVSICEEDYVICGAPELLGKYGITSDAPRPLANFQEIPFIAMANNLMFVDITYAYCLKAGFQPKVLLQTNDFVTKLQMTALGSGICFIPEICIPEFTAVRNDFRFIRMADIDSRRSVTLQARSSATLSPIAQAFLEYAKDYYRN